MLKRIQALRNIGRFKKCNPGDKDFGRLTIIYGRNTYGKSTLGDVFASIQENDGGRITSRMTIPCDGNPQEISLSFLPPNTTKEVPLTFANDTWKMGLPGGLGVRTFDDGFIHRNVFVARQFNRDTKENFSAFVLGEQGVQQAKAIADKKQARQKATRDRNQLIKVAFKDVSDLKSFVKLSPVGTLEESDAILQNLLNDHTAVRKQQDQIQTIQARDEGAFLTWCTDFSDALKALNQTLALSFEGVHKEAKAIVSQHINAAFQQTQGAEQWIRHGIQENKGELCQFCGQELTRDAHKLLDLYHQAFDDAFDKHDINIKQQLTKALAQVERLPVNNVPLTLAKNSAAYAGYGDLQTNHTYTSAVSKVAGLAEKIDEALSAIDSQLPEAINRLRVASTKKREAPHAAMETMEEASVSMLEKQVQQYVSDYNTWIRICNAEIAVFKKGTNEEALKKRLDEIEQKGKLERRNNNRIKLASQCEEYETFSAKIDLLDKQIEGLEKQLQSDQSDYLDKFFKSFNGWFRVFGSQDFSLNLGETRQGYTPIYFLKVKYKGEPIDKSALSQVFSESDRRALALAVFWTQLQSLPESMLAKQIVVLDDPLTSFDDHRVTAVHSELTSTVDKVRQVVVLSHYRHDIEMFFKTFRDHLDARLLVLIADGANGTRIEFGDSREFILTEHQKAHERMAQFECGQTNDHSFGDLRIFFEAEIDSRFAAQISQYNLARLQLGEKIDKLFQYGVIGDEVKQQCHSWRHVLNPSHHIWTGEDLENRRNTVRSFQDFVYNKLIREQ